MPTIDCHVPEALHENATSTTLCMINQEYSFHVPWYVYLTPTPYTCRCADAELHQPPPFITLRSRKHPAIANNKFVSTIDWYGSTLPGWLEAAPGWLMVVHVIYATPLPTHPSGTSRIVCAPLNAME